MTPLLAKAAAAPVRSVFDLWQIARWANWLQAQIAMHVATRATGQHQARDGAAKVRLADAE
jgi:hypothetical protein